MMKRLFFIRIYYVQNFNWQKKKNVNSLNERTCRIWPREILLNYLVRNILFYEELYTCIRQNGMMITIVKFKVKAEPKNYSITITSQCFYYFQIDILDRIPNRYSRQKLTLFILITDMGRFEKLEKKPLGQTGSHSVTDVVGTQGRYL